MVEFALLFQRKEDVPYMFSTRVPLRTEVDQLPGRPGACNVKEGCLGGFPCLFLHRENTYTFLEPDGFLRKRFHCLSLLFLFVYYQVPPQYECTVT